LRTIELKLLSLLSLVFMFVAPGFPQNSSSQPLTLEEAVNTASKNYPAIRASQAQAAAAKAEGDLNRLCGS